jgi:integrase
MPRGSKDGSLLRVKYKDKNDREQVRLYVRCRYTDNGRVREKKRRIDMPSHAPTAKRDLYAEIKKELEEPAEAAKGKTFAEFAKLYEAEYLVPPVYRGGLRIGGLKSYRHLKWRLPALTAFFGPLRLRSITYEDIKLFKKRCLDQKVVIRRSTKKMKEGARPEPIIRPRSLADVDRSLSLLRRMLNVAVQKRFLLVNPFQQGDVLISMAAEAPRMRILTHDEESRLLAACADGPVYLRPIVICALDTAMRKGEIFKLRWREVDLDEGVITICALNTKREVERMAPITLRLRTELQRLRAGKASDPDGLVFGVTADIQKSWTRALNAASIIGFRFHDLRHTGITWMLESGMREAKVMKISGHTQYSTFMRYVNLSTEIMRDAAELMNARRAQVESSRQQQQTAK